jgi:copper resistance protein B
MSRPRTVARAAALASLLLAPAMALAQHDMHAMPAAVPAPPAATPAAAGAQPSMASHAMHDDAVYGYLLFDHLEAGAGVQAWKAQAWLGTDLHRLWLRSEGERDGDGGLDHADVELLYGHPVSPWWDLLAGVRHDTGAGGTRDFLAVGVQGLAPYKIEVAATAYLGESGRTAARLELEYETRLTGRLILQPSIEANLHGRDDPRRGLGAGLSTLESGLRLRYEFTRRFAPYVGVVREHAFGRTADLRRANGRPAADTRVVAGLRTWF